MGYFDKYELRHLNKLDLLAKQVVEGFIIGLHKSPFHGFSVEFAEHRLYNTGDNTRNIDWKVFARTDKLFLKKYEEETNLRCQIVIDTSSSMQYPKYKAGKKVELSKFEFSALGAAALMNLLKRQRDAFGLTLFDEKIREHLRPKSSHTHYKLLLSKLENLITEPPVNSNTSAADALHRIAESMHKRSLVIIFSDMFERVSDSNELFNALQHLKHNKHEVILFHVFDRKTEIDFEFSERPHIFIDLESGQQVKVQPSEVREEYLKRISGFKKELKTKCLQYKMDMVEADIQKGYNEVLQAYLVKRKKMRI
ncbi:MAG: DUF58 domain-containing protein [Saprospirales bacterium]|nr:MAG: DUF58 domain-containing protein [Saprospirales bacterium]